MIAQDYLEIAEELQEVVWDIEDANDTHTNFSEGRFEELKKLYHKRNTLSTRLKKMSENYMLSPKYYIF